jgi:uncharacterized protein (TIGR02246 family)
MTLNLSFHRIAAFGMWVAAVSILTASAQAADQGAKSDEAAIRAKVESYTAAYNRGDAKAVAAHWSDSGEWISPSGQTFVGKKAIEKELRVLFAENKGVHIEVINPTVRLISPDTAIEEGTVRVLRAGEAPEESTYLALHVKKGGEWKLNTVRETDVPEAAAQRSPLEDLAWLGGQWTDTRPGATIAANVSWTKNKAFLTYSFKASAPGIDDLEGTQIVGWDPSAGTIRSWMFDSDGGFGEGIWSRKGDTWTIKFSQVLPDGRKASAVNSYRRLDENTMTWKSVNRWVGGQPLPNVEEVKLVRRTARDAVKEAAKKAGKTSEKGRKDSKP